MGFRINKKKDTFPKCHRPRFEEGSILVSLVHSLNIASPSPNDHNR